VSTDSPVIEWRGDQVRDKLTRDTMRAMDRIMADCVRSAKGRVRKDTTNLQRSIEMRPTVLEGGHPVGYWGSFNCRYALYNEIGTGLYGPYHQVIRPKTKKALWWPGAEHPVAYVKGMQPQPFLRPAADEVYPKLREYIREEFSA
jgi:HK97 gp10 family phage protein